MAAERSDQSKTLMRCFMPKRVSRYAIEHWRDGELVAKLILTKDHFRRQPDGTGCVLFPPGHIELATGDELRFDCNDLIELLNVNT